eukprot:3402152-Rhodomonas_salina.1
MGTLERALLSELLAGAVSTLPTVGLKNLHNHGAGQAAFVRRAGAYSLLWSGKGCIEVLSCGGNNRYFLANLSCVECGAGWLLTPAGCQELCGGPAAVCAPGYFWQAANVQPDCCQYTSLPPHFGADAERQACLLEGATLQELLRDSSGGVQVRRRCS